MNRKAFLKSSAFTMGALALANQRLFAGILQEPTWKIEMLTDSIGIFNEGHKGTIAFYIYKDGIIVVDAQTPDTCTHFLDEVKKKSTVPFELLINTHHHVDHSGGNILFKGNVKHIIAHENSKYNQMRVATIMKSEKKNLYPDMTFKETWCQKFGKENICLYYYGPAHTNGDAIVHFEYGDIVHLGDLVWNRKAPGIDRFAGASVKNWIQSLAKIYSDFGKNTRFIFGHSLDGFHSVGDREDLKAFSNYLSHMLLYVETQIKRGRTKKEIMKATGLSGTPEWKGEGFTKALAAAYDELTYVEDID